MKNTNKINHSSKIIIVIGSASGIGKELIRYLSKNFLQEIIAIDKNPSPTYKKKNLRYIQVDISNSKEFRKILTNVLSDFKEADIYFTAGIHNTFSASEPFSEELAFQQAKVNYIPHTLLVSVLLDLNIKSNIVISCSLSSIVGLPFQQVYSASKAATQYFYESISMELKKINSRAFIVRLGSVATGFNSLGNISPPRESGIYGIYKKAVSSINKDKQISPKEVAKYFSSLIKSKSKYGTFVKDYGKNSFILNIIRRIFGYRLTYKLSSNFLISGK